MINTTTMLDPIKGSVRDFLFQFQDENKTEMVQYGGEISWEVSSTITKDSLLLRFIPMVRFFTPYRIEDIPWGEPLTKILMENGKLLTV